MTAGNAAQESSRAPIRLEMDMFHDQDENIDEHGVAVIKEREDNKLIDEDGPEVDEMDKQIDAMGHEVDEVGEQIGDNDN